MAVFRYPIEIAPTMDGPFERLEAIVDTGSSYLWLPRSTLERLGVSALESREFLTATGARIVRDVGQVALRLDGRILFAICAFGDEGSVPLLGAVTLEQFGLAVDPVGRRLIPVPGYALAATAMTTREAIDAIVNHGRSLTEGEAAAVMEEVMSGQATPAQLGAFLVALRLKGETVDEMVGMARVMREKALRVPYQGELLDIVGTGGDGLDTFNVSTAAAFVAAACGMTVAKHGNRAASSQCGSADVLEALGARIELTPEQVARCLREVGVGFMFAPAYHPAMRFAAGPRREIGIRTVFNILGPLTNPAGAQAQLLGVPGADLAGAMAQALLRLGCRHVLVVHGQDGMDELTIGGETLVYEVKDGALRRSIVTPEEVGLRRAELASVKGGSPQENAAAMRRVLGGEHGPLRDFVLLNSAAGLVASDKTEGLAQGVPMAARAIDEGEALAKMDAFVALTQSFAEGA